MDSFQAHKTSGKKRKKFKQAKNHFNDEIRAPFDKKQNACKQEKNNQGLNSIKKKKLLALKNKSHFKQLKNKLHTTEISNYPKLVDKDNSNMNDNKSFLKNIKFSKSSLLPENISSTSMDKLSRKKSKKSKLAKNINFRKANISSNQMILEEEDKNVIQVKKTQKNIKMYQRRHKITKSTDDIQELQSICHKKFKRAKKLSLERKEIVSEDSEEEIEIRKELQNTSIYKKIQKLLKKNPSLSCGLSNDPLMKVEQIIPERNSDENSSCESTEYNESMSTSANKHDKMTMEKTFKRTPNTNEKTNLTPKIPVHNFLNQSERCLIRDQVNKSEKIHASTSLKNKARGKLQAAKFRFLNEKLYTENGKDSFTYFQDNQDEFQDYHLGYNLQISKWPMNPVDKIISSLQISNQTYVIADMGCGDAKIARTLTSYTVHSFDLVALNEHVTPCNISKVPLPNESVDVAVFCLSLMGTNWKEYLQEAHRILKMGGSLKIAEVESRIENLDLFVKNVQCLGFTLEKKDVEHKLFVSLDFKKEKKKKSKNVKVQDILLRPCLYKKR